MSQYPINRSKCSRSGVFNLLSRRATSYFFLNVGRLQIQRILNKQKLDFIIILTYNLKLLITM